jgi:hypothetical protein
MIRAEFVAPKAEAMPTVARAACSVHGRKEGIVDGSVEELVCAKTRAA